MGTEILSPCMNDTALPHELTWIQSLPGVPSHLHEHDKPNVMHTSSTPLILESLVATPPPSNNPSHNSKTQGTPIDLPQWTVFNLSKADDDNMAPAEMKFRSAQRVGPRTATHRQIANGADDERTRGASPSSVESLEIVPKLPKKPLFDGVLITSRAPKSKPPPATRSRTPTTSFGLLDALQRTFDANNRSSIEDDDAASIPQTDPEAATDDERVIRRPLLSPLKRRRSLYRRTSQSDNDTAEATTVFPDDLVKKRVKSIPYDSMPEVIDAALGTFRAPVQLGKVDELKDDGQAEGMEALCDGTSDALVDSDGGSPKKTGNCGSIVDHPLPLMFFKPPLLPSTFTATSGLPHTKVQRTGIITPHVSMHQRFQRKLHSLFGENAVVRMDRGARPRKSFFDYIHEPAQEDTATHPTTSEANGDSDDSPADNTPPAPVDSVQASSPIAPVQEHTTTVECVLAELPSMPRRSLKRRASQEVDADTHTSPVPHHNHGPSDTAAASGEVTDQPSANKRRRLDFSEVKLQGWVVNLQCLLKGKIWFTEKALKQVSDSLTQIDSVKSELDISIPIVKMLRQCIHKLAQLQDIPFGDSYNLRQKAHLIATAWA
ncbi:hypothetical protein EDD15DRAFT_1290395 [Pisolithus albus]|nr:hypothetical protein EDD15DRAFT_1290395 [Pisolithus albus]